MDDIDRRLWSAILILALPPAIALMWLVETTSPSTTASPLAVLLGAVLLGIAVAYAFGLLVSFLVVLGGLVVFNFFADLWWTLLEEHRSSRSAAGVTIIQEDLKDSLDVSLRGGR